jgi:hypothetical protein
MSLINFFLSYLKKVISLDLRALGLMRIGIGITILIDLIIRFSDLEAHYTDNGVLPLEALFRYLWDHRYFSIYTVSNSWQWLSLLFLINILSSFCLILGYKTRLFSVICWMFLLSLHNRNPLINQGGDDLLRLILFIGIFLPWGYCYSIDTVNNSNIKPNSYSYASVACFAYILQIICMYVFSALLKTSPEWTANFTALYFALSLDQILLPFGKFIFPYYNFLLVITFLVFYIELLLPFILLIPFYSNYFRIAFFIIIGCMHIGIVLSLNVGLFPLISIVSILGILPSSMFDRMDKMNISFQIKNFISKIPFDSSLTNYLNFPKENFIQSGVMFFFCICIVLVNLTTIGKLTFSSENNFNWLVKTTRIDQHWGMFAPAVFKDDGWFAFLGKREDKSVIDIHESSLDHKVNFNKPAYVAGTYKNDRWRKYSEGILMISNAHFRPFYCSFLLNNWNRNYPKQKINSLEIIYMKEISLANYAVNKPKKEMLCNCTLITE